MSHYTPIPLRSISPRHVRRLAQFFALKHAYEKGIPARRLSREAEDLIASFEWQDDLPGLSFTIRHAVVMAEGTEIGVDVIRLPEVRSIQENVSAWSSIETAACALMGQHLANVECELVLLTLECCLGNRGLAADVLGISVRTLRNKLKTYAHNGIPVPSAEAHTKHHQRHTRHSHSYKSDLTEFPDG